MRALAALGDAIHYGGVTPARRLRLALPILLAIAFGPFLNGEFVWDDAPLIEHNPAMRDHDHLGAVLTHDLWGQATGRPSQLYHPLPVLTVWAQAAVFGLHVAPMRTFNVLVHALCVALFALLLMRLGLPRVLALSTGCIVLVHPTVTEPVMWITGRHDTLAMTAVLGALLLWPDAQRDRASWLRAFTSGVLLALAFLSKEPYIVGPVLLLAYALTRDLGKRQRPRPLALGLFGLALAPLVAALALRRWLGISLGSSQLSVPLAEHARSFAGVVWHYAAQLLTFRNGPTLAPYVPLSDHAALLVWALLLGISLALTWLAWRRRASFATALLGWLWFLISLAPHVISVPTIGLYGNRYAYCGFFGLAMCIAALLSNVAVRSPRAERLARLGVYVVALALALATALEASHWRSNLTLYSADVERGPNNGYAVYHLGTAVLTAEGCAKALPLFVRATRLAPGYERAWHNAAGCLIDLGRGKEAAVFGERSVALAPRNARAHYNFAVCLLAAGDVARSIEHLHRSLQLEPGYAPARRALAELQSHPPRAADRDAGDAPSVP
jgi:4-amino-4-deoxy-L-arabinose transferase-like glycosyltransferase